jgi:hypothetical protein
MNVRLGDILGTIDTERNCPYQSFKRLYVSDRCTMIVLLESVYYILVKS